MTKEKKKEENSESKKIETKEERMAIVKKFADKVLEKYGKYVKAIVTMGSLAREEFKPKSDIDIFLILDDISFKLTNQQLDEIDADLEKIAMEIPEAVFLEKDPETGKETKTSIISVQPSYTLTEFWDYARVAHPIIYNFIKEGIAVYDTGFFGPIKKLLEMGKIPSTREAIENYMEGAPKKIMRAKTVKLLMLAEDAYYAMLNTAQAVLMFMGLEPPVPSKAYDEVMKYLVEPGILERQYADWLREIIDIRKKIEHKELLDVSGAFVDEWLDKAEKFVDKMFSLLSALEIRKKEKILEKTHEVMHKAALTALKTLHKLPEDASREDVEKQIGLPLQDAFKKEFIDTNRIEGYYWDIWKRIEELHKLSLSGKLDKVPEKEISDMREFVRRLIHDLARVLKTNETSKEK
jgi:uncharacterized protein (UPF0332 family)/predicted nucleotidyltransferase/ribulose bisphosphate carboxylase small subunit